jgi:hypothetical protein
VFVCIFLCVCVRENVCIDVCVCIVHVHMHLHVDMRLQLRIQARMSACACVRACMCLYAIACVRACGCLFCLCVVCMSNGGRGSWSSDWVGGGAGTAEGPSPLCSATHQTLFLAIPNNPGAFNTESFQKGNNSYLPRVILERYGRKEARGEGMQQSAR